MTALVLFFAGLMLSFTIRFLLGRKTSVVKKNSPTLISFKETDMNKTKVLIVICAVVMISISWGIYFLAKQGDEHLIYILALLAIFCWGLVIKFGSKLETFSKTH